MHLKILVYFLLFVLVSYFSIPEIIKFALKRKLVDIPDHRKVHRTLIPALGGIAVFICFVIGFMLGYVRLDDHNIWILIAGSLIVITGIVDDIKPQKATLKLGIQIISAAAAVFIGNYSLHSLSGTFGIFEINYWLSSLISIFIIITFINALNLIDGINGLASSLGILYFIFSAFFYFKTGNELFLIISLAMVASLLTFLRYNLLTPLIFLGDTGSTLIGFVAAIFLIDFLNSPDELKQKLGIINPYGISLSLFSIPLFDTFRVASIRLLKQKSPFSPDKTHIHHLFLRLDFKHYHITGILILANIILVLIAYFFQRELGDTLTITLVLGLFVFGFFILEFFIAKKFKMRYEEGITIQKFRQFVGDYWYLFFSIIVFVIPFQRWATSIPILVYSIFWLFSFEPNKVNLRDMSKYYILLPSSIFISSIIYYSALQFNDDILVNRSLRYLPLFIFPLFMFLKKEYFTLKKWYAILAFYLIGVLTFSTILLSIIFLKYFSGFKSDLYIQNEHIISNIPTIYYSLLICFAAMVTMYLRKSSINILQIPTVSFILLLFLTATMFLIHSKVGFVALILILGFGGWIQWLQYKKFQPATTILILALLYAIIFLFSAEKISVTHLLSSSHEVTMRIEQWSKAFDLIRRFPIEGLGTSYLQVLNAPSAELLNCHNQFMESWLEMGILGLLGYLLTIAFSIYQAVRSRDYFYLGFIILVSYYSLFESLFTNQTGIVFFALFNSLFLLKSRLRIKTRETVNSESSDKS